MEFINNDSFEIYITNLGRYNEGVLVGKWVDIFNHDEWEKELDSIGVKSGSEYEEMFITDVDASGIYECLYDEIKEYTSLSLIDELAEHLEEYNNPDVLKVIMSYGYSLRDAMAELEAGNYMLFDANNADELGHELVEMGILGEVSEEIKQYLNYAEIGEAREINESGCFLDNGGYIELSH